MSASSNSTNMERGGQQGVGTDILGEGSLSQVGKGSKDGDNVPELAVQSYRPPSQGTHTQAWVEVATHLWPWCKRLETKATEMGIGTGAVLA